MKRYVLIAFITVLAVVECHAANDVVVDGVTYSWSRDHGAYFATGWDEETPVQSLHIRAVVDDLDVIGVADAAFEDNEDIVYLTIDEGITSIGENAFCRCINLQVAILPEGLEVINEEAFAFCSNLTTMVIPSTVTDIQAHAFSGCLGVTDVYFLMTEEEQLDGFDWWDGVYPSPGEEEHGGLEFGTPEHTVVHVPAGTYDIYDNSGKLEAWLFQEDNNCYPLWWIVNFGVVGREYTVSDDLTAVHVGVDGGLYAKDDNFWLTPDEVYPDEVDFMADFGLMSAQGNEYDQSNWVALTDVDGADALRGHIITGMTITGILKDKKNPVIQVSEGVAPVKGNSASFVPNIYVPASFMSRTQLGADGDTYAFVQPKPQEIIHVAWTVYNEDDGCFYLPEPDDEEDVNLMELKGGFQVSYGLYEKPSLPQLEDGGTYEFNAVNRLVAPADEIMSGKPKRVAPYTDGGVSDSFVVYPLEINDNPVVTGIDEITPAVSARSDWYTIDGRSLGTARPTVPGLYINGHRKVVVR